MIRFVFRRVIDSGSKFGQIGGVDIGDWEVKDIYERDERVEVFFVRREWETGFRLLLQRLRCYLGLREGFSFNDWVVYKKLCRGSVFYVCFFLFILV